MSTTAFPVRQTEDGTGCTDTMLRSIVAALYPDPGIIKGLAVTGGNTLAYNVAEGAAVCSKGAADGNTLAYCEGGTVAASANSASNPRIDVVWITSHDVTQGDSDNLVTLGVTEGTAAATPVEPDIPSYATKLAAMQLPAGATTTASATAYGSSPYALPYGTTNGILGEFVNTMNGAGDRTVNKAYVEESVTFYVPTKRTVQVSYDACVSLAYDGLTTGGFVVHCNWGIFAILIDGQNIPHSRFEWGIGGSWETHSAYVIIEVDAGEHTIAVRNGLFSQTNNHYGPYFHYTSDNGEKSGCSGRTLRVTDLGPAD